MCCLSFQSLPLLAHVVGLSCAAACPFAVILVLVASPAIAVTVSTATARSRHACGGVKVFGKEKDCRVLYLLDGGKRMSLGKRALLPDDSVSLFGQLYMIGVIAVSGYVIVPHGRHGQWLTLWRGLSDG